MKPLLAHVYEPHRVTYPCYVQPKLNGVRALYQWGAFQSRDEMPFPPGLLDHLAKPLKEIFGPETILDGELYVHGWPLGRILSAITPIATKRGVSKDTLKVEYHVFDVVDFGKSFKGRLLTFIKTEICLTEEGARFYGLEKWNIHFSTKLVMTRIVNDEIEADNAYSEFVSNGFEGMMYRLGDCPYTVPKQKKEGHWYMANKHGETLGSNSSFLSDKDNRTWHLLKRKDWQDDIFPITSFNLTTGELGEEGFQLWVIAKNGQHFKVGSGLSAQERQYYSDNSPAGRQAKLKYLVLSADGIPQNATIEAIL